MKPQFRKIVVGVDFSDASLAGARWVATHLAPQAELLIVHVVAVPNAPMYLREYIGSTIHQRARSAQALYTALRGFAGLLGADRVRIGIRTGVPWSELARVADEVKADLICVGRGQKRQGSSRFGATTPQRLLAISKVPVLVIPQGVERPGRVLAALSAHAGDERVISVAKALANAWDSRFEAVHVVETDVHQTARTSAVHGSVERIRAKTRTEGRTTGIDSLDDDALCALASEWLSSTVLPASADGSAGRVVRLGDAGQELIACARDEACPSVVVMGRARAAHECTDSTTGYHCGSTTRMVLWSAPGPVFVLPLEARFAHPLSLRIASSESHPALRVGHRNGDGMVFVAPNGPEFGGGGDAA
jgi:nucleotide-binding universal stress UspA family protein